MTTFIDTSAFLAIFAIDDKFHALAKPIWERLIIDEEQLVTNNYVLLETLTLLQRRLGVNAARSFQFNVLPSLQIRWVDHNLHDRAMAALLATNQRYLSLVDCCAFEMMREDGIVRAFAFDDHYKDQGFETIS